MSERETRLLLDDIALAIDKIFSYTQGTSFEDYESDSKTKDAVERNFEIIGEAASRIPNEFKLQHPTVEWRILKDFRNFIVHEYFGVNNQIIWDTIEFRLSDLKEKISELI